MRISDWSSDVCSSDLRAQLLRVARGAGAGGAGLGFAEVAAARAVADAFDRLGQRVGQPPAAIALAFEHVVGHALRGLLADAGQDAEGFDQLFEQRSGHRGPGGAATGRRNQDKGALKARARTEQPRRRRVRADRKRKRMGKEWVSKCRSRWSPYH